MKNISIKDIALEVGVSTTTVSFVLNGKAKEKRISEELRDRILETAARLNYRPNQVARGLRTGHTNTLGLIVEDISNPFFAQLARVVEHEADRAGYTVMFCSTENSDERATALLYMLRHRQMDGFIIVPTPGLKKEIQLLSDDQRPFVLVDRYYPELDTCYVAVDNFRGAFEGASLLLRRGYRNIALVTVDSIQVQMMERERGFNGALERAKKKQGGDHVLRIPYDYNTEKTVQTIADFIRKHPQVDGIFFTTNYLGVAGLEAIRMSGKCIPAEMGVVCFDDNDLFRLGSPSISVIAQPIAAIAEKAVEILVSLLTRREPPANGQVIIPPSIQERESTAGHA